MIGIRRLPPEEWPLIEAAYKECRAENPLPLPKNDQGIIIAAEDAGKVVGCVGAERTWHVSPFWADKDHRGEGLPRQLAETIATYNTERLPEMLVTTNPHVEILVYRLGFVPIPGAIWRRSL